MTDFDYTPGRRVPLYTGRSLDTVEIDHATDDLVVYWYLRPMSQNRSGPSPEMERNGCDVRERALFEKLVGYAAPNPPDLTLIAVCVPDSKEGNYDGWKFEQGPHLAGERNGAVRDYRVKAQQRGGWFVRYEPVEIVHYPLGIEIPEEDSEPLMLTPKTGWENDVEEMVALQAELLESTSPVPAGVVVNMTLEELRAAVARHRIIVQ